MEQTFTNTAISFSPRDFVVEVISPKGKINSYNIAANQTGQVITIKKGAKVNIKYTDNLESPERIYTTKEGESLNLFLNGHQEPDVTLISHDDASFGLYGNIDHSGYYSYSIENIDHSEITTYPKGGDWLSLKGGLITALSVPATLGIFTATNVGLGALAIGGMLAGATLGGTGSGSSSTKPGGLQAAVTFSPEDLYTTDTPQMSGTATPGATITIMDGDKVVGTTTVDADGKWSVKTNNLLPGDHHLTAIATYDGATATANGYTQIKTSFGLQLTQDAGTNQSTAPLNKETDDNTPTVTSTEATPKAAGDIVTITVKEAAGGTVTTTLTTVISADGTWTVETSALQNGTYSVGVVVTDKAGNVSQEQITHITINAVAALAGSTPSNSTDNIAVSESDGSNIVQNYSDINTNANNDLTTSSAPNMVNAATSLAGSTPSNNTDNIAVSESDGANIDQNYSDTNIDSGNYLIPAIPNIGIAQELKASDNFSSSILFAHNIDIPDSIFSSLEMADGYNQSAFELSTAGMMAGTVVDYRLKIPTSVKINNVLDGSESAGIVTGHHVVTDAEIKAGKLSLVSFTFDANAGQGQSVIAEATQVDANGTYQDLGSATLTLDSVTNGTLNSVIAGHTPMFNGLCEDNAIVTLQIIGGDGNTLTFEDTTTSDGKWEVGIPLEDALASGNYTVKATFEDPYHNLFTTTSTFIIA